MLLNDKDLVSFRAACKAAQDAVEGDAGALWRRRFFAWFETPQFQLTGQRKVDLANFKVKYQQRKAVLHVIKQIFQIRGNAKPTLSFDTGRRRKEQAALRVLRDLINGVQLPISNHFLEDTANIKTEAFSDKQAGDIQYNSKNLKRVAEFIQKTNILKILGKDGRDYFALKPSELPHHHTSLLYTIQCVLAPLLFCFDDWHMKDQSGFHEAQKMVYLDNITAPILTGLNGQSVNMTWLLKNIQFWRYHFLTVGEPLCPHFEGLEDNQRPDFWASQLRQGTRRLGFHWKGSYAFVDRAEIQIIRKGESGQGHNPQIQDKLNGEEDPDSPFQSVDLALCSTDDSSTWNRDFERHLNSLKTPKTKDARTRAQKSATGGPSNGEVDFATSSYRFDGDGNDYEEEFHMQGWLNPLPPQNGIPGWQRVTMMKYFVDKYDSIDMEALWAYEGIMFPGGMIMMGRWWCPTDGVGEEMYSGPFVLWNVPCDNECVCADHNEFGDGMGV